MSERKRGIICAYCGMAWGYDDVSPTPELIKVACDHESICEKNPYTAQIRNLKQERDEAREKLRMANIESNARQEIASALKERDEARKETEYYKKRYEQLKDGREMSDRKWYNGREIPADIKEEAK